MLVRDPNCFQLAIVFNLQIAAVKERSTQFMRAVSPSGDFSAGRSSFAFARTGLLTDAQKIRNMLSASIKMQSNGVFSPVMDGD